MESCDEADVSTFKPGAQAAPRVSCAHGHQSWTQNTKRAAGAGPEAAQRLIGMVREQTAVALREAVPPPLRFEVLKQRADFIAASRAQRQVTPSLVLRARQRGEGEADDGVMRVGFTCSKKVGNAVARNRAKRRLREAARATLPFEGRHGWDYVLIGRAENTASLPFHRLIDDLRRAIAKVHNR